MTILLPYLITKITFFRISKERFLDLANQICQIFPCETPETYYIPAYRNPVNGKSISAHGKLYDRYANLRAKYQALELISKRSLKNQTSPRSNKFPTDGKHYIMNMINVIKFITLFTVVITEEISEVIHWLKQNTSPWHQVVEFWKQTSTIRLNQFFNQRTPIHEYFQIYSCLSMPLGYSLVIKTILSYDDNDSTLNQK